MKRSLVLIYAYLIGKLRIIFLFVFSFIITAFLIHLSIDNPQRFHAEGRAEKIKLINDWHGQINVAVFGTSRIHEGFNPEIFDSAFNNSSYKIKSLNLALYGGSQTEQKFVASEYLRQFLPPQNSQVCLLMLELNAGLNFPPENRFHPRAVNIYDWEMVRFVYEFSDESLGLVRRVGRAGFALIAGIAHYSNAGMFSGIVFPAIKENITDNSRGIKITEANEQETKEVEDFFRTHTQKTTMIKENFISGNYLLLKDLEGLTETKIPVNHSQFAYVITPNLTDLEVTYIYPPEIKITNSVVPVFNLARPDLYPELYEAKYWRNKGHLNTKGAELFTRFLAQEVRLWLKKSPHVKRCGE